MSSEAKRRAARKYKKNHPDRAKQSQDKYRAANPDKVREANMKSQLKRVYGLTRQEIQLMLILQEYKCAGCAKEFNDKVKEHVDHNHETKIVRGLLCMQCNFILGLAKDNPQILRRLADYLE